MSRTLVWYKHIFKYHQFSLYSNAEIVEVINMDVQMFTVLVSLNFTADNTLEYNIYSVDRGS